MTFMEEIVKIKKKCSSGVNIISECGIWKVLIIIINAVKIIV